MASSQWSVVVMNRTGTFARPVQDGSNLGRTADLLGINGSLVPILDWDSWDESLWTSEQRLMLEQGIAPRHVYVSMGVLLSLVVVFGLIANATILYVFSRFKRLRTPANVFIINLTACDFFSCLIHPMAIYSSFRGRWSFGRTGCNLYATCVGFFGLNSIVTLSAIACERYIVITSSSCRPAVTKWRITRCQAQKACAGIWLHCAALVAPPLLFGWSSYQPEGVLVTCSWDYTSRTLSNRLYYLYLLILGFVLPVSVLTYCYSAIFRFIVHSSREMTRLIMTGDGRASFSKTTMSFRKRRRQTDVRTALIILSLALLCFTAWTPYAIVSLIGQFGPLEDDDDDGQLKLSPLTTSIPAFLAKTAIVFDPLVYGLSHPQFRSSVRQILQHHSIESSNNGPGRGGVINHNQTTFMMVTGGIRNLLHRQSQSSGTSSAAMSWAKKSEQNKGNSDVAISSDGGSTTSYFKPMSFGSNPLNLRSRQPKRAMSLGAIMWRKKASVGLSGRRIDKDHTTIASGNQWHSGTEEEKDRTAAVFRSKGDVFYLFRGQPRTICRASWINKENQVIQLPSGINPGINHKSRGPHRRSSEPNLMHCSNNRLIASTLSCDDCRRKRSNYAGSAIFNSTNNLTSRPEPIFVIVSLPAVCHKVNGSSVSLSVPAIDNNYHLCQNKNRIIQCRQTRSTGNSPSLSVRSATKNLGHKFWPKYHSMAHQDSCHKTHRPVSQPSAWRNSAPKKEGFNSLSCPLISP